MQAPFPPNEPWANSCNGNHLELMRNYMPLISGSDNSHSYHLLLIMCQRFHIKRIKIHTVVLRIIFPLFYSWSNRGQKISSLPRIQPWLGRCRVRNNTQLQYSSHPLDHIYSGEECWLPEASSKRRLPS